MGFAASLITAGALIVLALVTGFAPFYFLLYSVPPLLLLSYAWSWTQGRGLDITVEPLTSRPQVGTTLQIRTTVRELIGLPRIGLGFTALTSHGTADERRINLRPRATASWIDTIPQQRRGINYIGAINLSTSDPLGISQINREIGEGYPTIVYPKTLPLSAGLSVGPATLGDVGTVSHMLAHSTVASRIREYVPGDRLSHIHWPSTARRDQLMSKEFDGGGHSEIWIFLDLQSGPQAGTYPDTTEEYGVTIAASLSKALIEAGQRVGFVTSGETLHNVHPSREREHAWDILTILALVKAESLIPMTSLIMDENLRIPSGSLAVIVSPDRAGNQRIVSQHFSSQGIGLITILFETSSFYTDSSAIIPQRRGTSSNMRDFIIRQGDDLAYSLNTIMDQLIY